MESVSQIQATLLGVAVAALAFVLAVATYRLSQTFTPMAALGKLWDRMYELDKLALAYGKPFAKFMSLARTPDPYFYALESQVPHTDEYYQLKAIAYLYLNYFEEIYLATSASPRLARSFERDGWNKYIFRKMRHALLREVFLHEADTLYRGAFADYLKKHQKDWSGLANPNDV